MGRRLSRAEMLARMHPGLRPKLSKSQVTDLGLVHLANVDTIARGGTTGDILLEWGGGAWTWAHVAGALERRDRERFGEAAQAMRLQLDVFASVLERYKRTGIVGFSGPEYQRAKDACEWMDALAEVVDRPTALIATDMAELRMNAMAAELEQRQEQTA